MDNYAVDEEEELKLFAKQKKSTAVISDAGKIFSPIVHQKKYSTSNTSSSKALNQLSSKHTHIESDSTFATVSKNTLSRRIEYCISSDYSKQYS